MYCCMPDGLKGEETYGVDHYRPEKWFPELRFTWSNLFYACNRCNSLKRDVRPKADCFIPNPCDHQVGDHLQFIGADIEAYTLPGRFTVTLLGLADVKHRKYREFILREIGRLKTERARLLAHPGQSAKMTPEALSEVRNDLAVLEDDLRRLTGA